MNNYRNYGNRRFSNDGADCGCNGNNSGRMMQGNYGRNERRQGMDYGSNKGEMKGDSDCGCDKSEVKSETDCGCDKKDESHEKDCGCSIESMYREVKKNGICCEEDMPGKALAMAYVPWQSWKKLYEICEGFSKGTIFKELDLEFYGRRCN